MSTTKTWETQANIIAADGEGGHITLRAGTLLKGAVATYDKMVAFALVNGSVVLIDKRDSKLIKRAKAA
jgi:hypothetical protein